MKVLTRSSARPILRTALALAAVVALLAVGTTPVLAHSYLKTVSPADGSVLDASPESIVLTFTANVLPDFSQISLSCDGKELTGLAAPTTTDNVVTQTLAAGAAAGACVLTFRIVSADSHPISGRSSFTVKTSASSDSPAASTSPSPSSSASTPSPSDSSSTTVSPSAASSAPSTPASTSAASSSWLSTALLLLLAAGLLAIFAWLARGRIRRR